MIVAVVVVVTAPVIVAALVNGNDIVDVFDTVDGSGIDEPRQRSDEGLECVVAEFAPLVSLTASITAHGFVPVHERDHVHAADHEHGNVRVASIDRGR